MHPAARRIVSCALLLVLVGLRLPAHADDGVLISVEPDQRATVVGSSNSVRSAVERLAWHAGMHVNAYHAPDRSFTVAFENRPLPEVLASLLRQESYVLGMRDDRVTSIHVLGDHAGAVAMRTARVVPDVPFQVPPALTRDAFASDDPRVREDALRTIVDRVTGNPTERSGFLALDAQVIARTIADYPHADAMLRSLEPSVADPELRAKLGEIRRALGELSASAARR